MNLNLLIALLLALSFTLVSADIPVHCEFPAVRGDWIIRATATNLDKSAPFKQCPFSEPLTLPVASVFTISLDGPNVATVRETGEHGRWTMVDDEGVEITIGGNRFFAFFNFTRDGAKWKSNCGLTTTGWFHAVGVNVSQWGCWAGAKPAQSLTDLATSYSTVKTVRLDATFANDRNFIDQINKAQQSWVAGEYPEFEGRKYSQLVRMAGSPLAKHKMDYRRRHKQYMMENFGAPQELSVQEFPDNFDWRNSTLCGTVNCVSPVRNQQSCGSCYIFSAGGSLESRVRIASKGKIATIFSPQDEIGCNPYNQGCSGGEPLLASKYFQDFGITTESCDPYVGHQTTCPNKCPYNTRTFVHDYRYIGNYYGACTEQGMMKAIYESGPITVAFMVYRDFYNYKGGVYHHVGNVNEPDPHWEPVNHGVIIVGWGVTPSGEKYWICKNSWSNTWGLQGYFLIRRGVNECSIESAATEDFPIVN